MLSRKAYEGRKNRLIAKDRVKRLLIDHLGKYPDLIRQLVPRTPPPTPPPRLHEVEPMLAALEVRQHYLTYAEYHALQDLLYELQWYRDHCACD